MQAQLPDQYIGLYYVLDVPGDNLLNVDQRGDRKGYPIRKASDAYP